jgi:8-oxo-dGTP diphosphatase
VRYRDAKGRPKRVRYWRMAGCDGEFEPNDEVDEARWVGRGEALELLSHPHDRDLVAAAL